MPLISPLGGQLVDRVVSDANHEGLVGRAERMPSTRLGDVAIADLGLIGSGAYSPLTGFLSQPDYDSVVDHAALAGGTPWTLPITLPVPALIASSLRSGDELALRDGAGELRGVIEVADVFRRDALREADQVYGTTDTAHPGVRALLTESDVLVGGAVSVFRHTSQALALTPREVRDAFTERNWSTVVAFQTRNPVHRAHEYLTKVALEQVDGLLLHPLVGATKDDDIPADVRMHCYRVLLDGYYPPGRVLLATFAAAMRYAGPREAIFHGLVRRNFGCSHFIIGRDAAGVGNYYGTYDAQRLYDDLGGADRLGFQAFKFEHTFWCNTCEGMASDRTCPHPADARLVLSGTRVRELLRAGSDLPREFTRPVVAAVLGSAYAVVPEEVPA